MKYQVTEDMSVELRVGQRVIERTYTAGVHEPRDRDDEVALEHLRILGAARRPQPRLKSTAKRKSNRRQKAAPDATGGEQP